MLERIACSLLTAGGLSAQSLQVYSEFQRVDPFGNIVAADKMERPREILSPAVARNAWASFHLMVTVPQDTPSFLYIQQNPEILNVTLYKELYVKTAQGWVPDGLEKVSLPHFLILPEPGSHVAGQTTLAFWLDLWVPAGAPVRRMRIEAVLNSGDQWRLYPMEIRIMQAVAPGIQPAPGRLPPVSARADASVYGPLHKYLCGMEETGSGPLSVRQLIWRNACQDIALAGSPGRLRQALQAAGINDPCGPAPRAPAEWYLRARDFLLRSPTLLP